MNLRKLMAGLGVAACLSMGWAQHKVVQILNTDQLIGIKIDETETLQKFIGHVRVLYDGTYFECDSAYNYEQQNVLEAYSRVKMRTPDSVTLTCKKLVYDANTRIANIYQNAVITDGKATLYSEHLIYYRTPNYGMYPNFGKLVDSVNTLTSRRGYYFPDRDMAYFRYTVKLVNKDFTLTTDSLGYNTEIEEAYLYDHAVVVSEDGTLEANSGTYNANTRIANMYNKCRVENEDYILHSDTLYYEDSLKYGIARNHVDIYAKDSTLQVLGDYGYFNDKSGVSYVTRSPLALQFDTDDTLYLRADTLFLIRDVDTVSRDTNQILRAFRHVRFARNDLQGKADSLVYFSRDSTMQLFISPVLWSNSSQITGDSIFVFSKKGELDSLWVGRDGFIITREDTVGYNQIKGRHIYARFRDKAIYKVFVETNAQSIYYIKNDKGHYQGMNKAEGENMLVRFTNRKASRIQFIKKPVGEYKPLYTVLFTPQELEKFAWLEEKRPTKAAIKTNTPTPEHTEGDGKATTKANKKAEQ